MTCGLAVKRPLDFESYLSPESSIEKKRARQTNPQCSPFRPQLGTLASSLSSTQTQRNITTSDQDNPFDKVSNKCQLSSNQLDSYLRAEIQYLKRRKLIPRRNVNLQEETKDDNPSTACYRGATSPSSTGSDSDNESSSMGHYEKQKSLNQENNFLSDLYEKPQFSLCQVKMIFERLLKEQEQRLRYEYQTLLIKKLEEKHDQYLQFAKEHFENQNKLARECSFIKNRCKNDGKVPYQRTSNIYVS